MTTNQVEILIKARDEATAALKNVATALGNLDFTSGERNLSKLTDGIEKSKGGFLSMAGAMFTGQMAYDAFLRTVRAGYDTIKAGIKSIDDLRLAQASMASAAMQPGANFDKLFASAGAVVDKVYELDRAFVGTGDELLMLADSMVTFGMGIDLSTKKAQDQFVAFGNTIKLMTKGQNFQIQAYQEIRALMSGMDTHGAMLVKKLEAAGVNAKVMIPMWREQGTLLENIMKHLSGYEVGAKKIEQTLSAQASSMETISKKILREGFAKAYEDITAFVKKINDALLDQNGLTKDALVIVDLLALGWDAVKDAATGAWKVISGIASGMGWIVDKWKEIIAAQKGFAPPVEGAGAADIIGEEGLTPRAGGALTKEAAKMWEGMLKLPGAPKKETEDQKKARLKLFDDLLLAQRKFEVDRETYAMTSATKLAEIEKRAFDERIDFIRERIGPEIAKANTEIAEEYVKKTKSIEDGLREGHIKQADAERAIREHTLLAIEKMKQKELEIRDKANVDIIKTERDKHDAMMKTASEEAESLERLEKSYKALSDAQASARDAEKAFAALRRKMAEPAPATLETFGEKTARELTAAKEVISSQYEELVLKIRESMMKLHEIHPPGWEQEMERLSQLEMKVEAGQRAHLKKLEDDYREHSARMREMSAAIWSGITQNFDDLFFNAMTGKLTSFKDFVMSVYSSIARGAAKYVSQMVADWLLGLTKMQGIKAGAEASGGLMSLLKGFVGIASAFGGAPGVGPEHMPGTEVAPGVIYTAEGGIYRGGWTPIKAFAGGGVVNRPTLGLVGEGSGPEAVIPLKGGSVPVTLSGGRGDTNINFQIVSADAQDFDRLIASRRAFFTGIVRDELRNALSMRDAVKRYAT